MSQQKGKNMITMNDVNEQFCYYISYNEIENIVYDDLGKGIAKLIFHSCEVLDNDGKKIELNYIEEYNSIKEYYMFKKVLINKINELKKYILIYIEHAKSCNADYTEDQAKEFWNDCDNDDYPKDSFDSFDNWYESKDYYDWLNDQSQDSWNFFSEENSELYNAISSDKYIDHYDNITDRWIKEDFDSVIKDLSSMFNENEILKRKLFTDYIFEE